MKATTRVSKKSQFGKNQFGRKGQFKKVKSKVDAPDAPQSPMVQESNPRGDKLATLLFAGIIVIAALVLVGSSFYSISLFSRAIQASPVEWMNVGISSVTLVVSVVLVRALIWLSLFGSMSLAVRLGGWNAIESTSKKALMLPNFLSRGSAWASLFLVQSLVSRGKYDEAREAAESEWERSGWDEKQAQSLGPLATTVGMSLQAQGDMKNALKWNERGIEMLNKCIEFVNRPNKGFFEKAAATQAGDWMGQIKAQLATAHFANGTIYFNKMDYRRAKENYKKAVDYANQSVDFPQKDYMLQMGKEQLQRLKHR